MPYSRFTLDINEILIVIDFKHRLSAVDHFPHHYGSNFYRVAGIVVNLHFAAFKVTYPKRHFLLAV